MEKNKKTKQKKKKTTKKQKKKNNLYTPIIDLEQWMSTCKRPKIRMNSFSINRLLVDDRSVLQNRRWTIKFWPILNIDIL